MGSAKGTAKASRGVAAAAASTTPGDVKFQLFRLTTSTDGNCP